MEAEGDAFGDVGGLGIEALDEGVNGGVGVNLDIKGLFNLGDKGAFFCEI